MAPSSRAIWHNLNWFLAPMQPIAHLAEERESRACAAANIHESFCIPRDPAAIAAGSFKQQNLFKDK